MNGIQPTDEKARAITEAPAPKNGKELKSFLRLLNYYGKFLPDLASALEPLDRLLRKEVWWQWKKDQQGAFQKAKCLLKSTHVLTLYDDRKKLVVSCDASPYGVGAVLVHIMPDGIDYRETDRVCFAYVE